MLDLSGIVSIATGEEGRPAGLHTPRHRRSGATRKPRSKPSTAPGSTGEGEPLADLDTSQVKQLLEEFAPGDEEPVALREESALSPIGQRLRARSGHPHVFSVPAD